MDLEEFLYELDNAGNITKTTELDGTVWDYEYPPAADLRPDRYRLTLAEAKSHGDSGALASAPREGPGRGPATDDGDNLLTKETPLQENFDDYYRDGWAGAASYVVTKAYLERESGSPDAGVCRVQSNNDFQIWFSYKHGGSYEGQVRLRESGGWVGVCGITGSGAVDLRDAPYRMEIWTGPVFSANAEIQRRGHTNLENPLDSRVRGKDEPEA